MASMSISEEDLSCPVCCDIFKDPVLLSCSHSVCKGCLQQFWRTKRSRECPICRTISPNAEPPLNLLLKNLCENFPKGRSQRDPFCSLHHSELKLFCEDDKQLLCLVCRDSKLHKKHNFSPISEAALERKDELKVKLQPLQNELDTLKHTKQCWDEATQNIQIQAQHTERQIKQEFEKLHQCLRDEEAARIAALREEEEQKSQMMKEKIEKMSREISSLSDTIRAIDEDMGADDITFLQNYKSTVERARWTQQGPDRDSGAAINVAKHLDSLQFRVWEKMQEIEKGSELSYFARLGYEATAGMKTKHSSVARNLLKNPSGEKQMEFWELTKHGGQGWRVEEMPSNRGDPLSDDGIKKYFVTSFNLCLKRQVVDLVAEGYSLEDLDTQPAVTVEDWYSGRTDCGCIYQLTVCLLDGNQQLLATFKPADVTLDPRSGGSWKQVTHTFSRYGRGLRFVSIEHGGKDTSCWAGWYGVRVTGSVIRVEL